MRVICLVEHPDHVCCRYRLAALRPHLEEQGIQLDLLELPGNLLARLNLLRKLRGQSVILQRKLLSWLELKVLRTKAAWLAFDLDDAVFLRDSYSPKGHKDARRLARFRRLMVLSDCVFAGNHFLAGQARQEGATGAVVVVPTSIEPALYPVRPKTSNKSQDEAGLQMTWIGSSSTLQGLERMATLFNRIGAEIPGISLRVISDRFPAFERLRVIQIPWSGKTEASELAQGDVGISWIPDDPWSRGKCGLKVLQYMAAGLPVLANPVGVHPEMIRPGKEGFLPANDDEWLMHLRTLDQDRQALHTLGTTGRNRVEKDYSVANAARLVACAIHETVGRSA